MQCEICEKGIEKGKRIKLEGSIVVACEGCSKYGEVVSEAQPPKAEGRGSRTRLSPSDQRVPGPVEPGITHSRWSTAWTGGASPLIRGVIAP